MQTYIGFLRGVNVGGHRKVPMADLRQALGRFGLENVKTYVQSGNMVFRSEREDEHLLTSELEACMEEAFGFPIPLLLYRTEVIRRVLLENPFDPDQGEPGNKMYYVFWKTPPSEALAGRLDKGNYPGQKWHIGPTGLYLWCENGYGQARLGNNQVERLGETLATTRNHRTLSRMFQMAERLGMD